MEPPPKAKSHPGHAPSRGIAYGQVFLYLQSETGDPEYTVDPDKRAAEIARFEQALLSRGSRFPRFRTR